MFRSTKEGKSMADIPEAIKKHLHELGLSREQACWEEGSVSGL